jgi:histidine triad (HIT) family protein
MPCPFCKIAREDPHDQILFRANDCFVIEPLDPVVQGHLLVIPDRHVPHAAYDPAVTMVVMRVAACVAYGAGDCNIITSIGEAATQTVQHLHVHIVPRRPGDGLQLPWTGQSERAR